MVSLETKIKIVEDWTINQQSWKKLAKKYIDFYNYSRIRAKPKHHHVLNIFLIDQKNRGNSYITHYLYNEHKVYLNLTKFIHYSWQNKFIVIKLTLFY